MVPPLTAIQRSNSEEFIQVSDDLLTCLLISTAMDQPMVSKLTGVRNLDLLNLLLSFL